MNSCLSIHSTTVSTTGPSGPIELDVETLKRVAGGVIKIPDPGWVVSPGSPTPAIKVGDPVW
jgi:hypothetical protein